MQGNLTPAKRKINRFPISSRWSRPAGPSCSLARTSRENTDLLAALREPSNWTSVLSSLFLFATSVSKKVWKSSKATLIRRRLITNSSSYRSQWSWSYAYPLMGKLNIQEGNSSFSASVVLTVTIVASIGFLSLSWEGDSSQRSFMLKPQAEITSNASYREVSIIKATIIGKWRCTYSRCKNVECRKEMLVVRFPSITSKHFIV